MNDNYLLTTTGNDNKNFSPIKLDNRIVYQGNNNQRQYIESEFFPIHMDQANRDMINMIDSGRTLEEINHNSGDVLETNNLRSKYSKAKKVEITAQNIQGAIGITSTLMNIVSDASAHNASIRGDNLTAERIQNRNAARSEGVAVAATAVGAVAMVASGNVLGAVLSLINLVNIGIKKNQEIEKYQRALSAERYQTNIERERFVRNVGEQR